MKVKTLDPEVFIIDIAPGGVLETNGALWMVLLAQSGTGHVKAVALATGATDIFSVGEQVRAVNGAFVEE